MCPYPFFYGRTMSRETCCGSEVSEMAKKKSHWPMIGVAFNIAICICAFASCASAHYCSDRCRVAWQVWGNTKMEEDVPGGASIEEQERFRRELERATR